jgi:hypothetical protein
VVRERSDVVIPAYLRAPLLLNRLFPRLFRRWVEWSYYRGLEPRIRREPS